MSVDKSMTVGQAALNLLAMANASHDMQEVQETIDAMTPAYWAEFEDCAKKNSSKYQGKFYIVCLRKKESCFVNVLRQWFIARQTRPLAFTLRRDFYNFDHDVWEIDKCGQARLLWTLPPAQDCLTIMKHPELYHSDLTAWIKAFDDGTLDLDNQLQEAA